MKQENFGFDMYFTLYSLLLWTATRQLNSETVLVGSHTECVRQLCPLALSMWKARRSRSLQLTRHCLFLCWFFCLTCRLFVCCDFDCQPPSGATASYCHSCSTTNCYSCCSVLKSMVTPSSFSSAFWTPSEVCENFDFLVGWLAIFGGKIPTQKCTEDCLIY